MNWDPDKTRDELLSEERIDQLFCQALDLPADQRESFLREACGGNRRLLEEVLALVDGAEQADPFLRQGGAVAEGLLDEVKAPGWIAPGSEVGRFRVLEEIGRGGMGVVYLAERSDGQFHQKVALKVMAGGSDRQAVERFTRERQILADVEHPNIARLLDGGITEGGHPFLVMEHVEGRAITRHCDGLSLERRLELLIDVCAAVQAAHQQLVVHQDLKPSNILVTEDGKVKLLDFGVAKLISEERASATATRDRFLTPQYASPEQVRGESITVASDVYQLGLIAYELITGRKPYNLSRASAATAERKICEEIPTRPSSVVTQTHKSSGLRTRLKVTGDLDTIVLKALHKEPGRRYSTVEQLRDDLQRFLDRRPILARPYTVSYRLKKFVGRHALASAIAAMALLAIVTQTVAFTSRLARERDETRKQALRAEAKSQETEEVVDFLVNLFSASNPFQVRPDDLNPTARELLERGVAELETAFPEQPLIRARLLQTTGEIYYRMERFEESEDLLSRALEIRENAPGDHPVAVADSLSALGDLYVEASRHEEAESLLRRALEAKIAIYGPEHKKVAIAYLQLANLLHRRGRYKEVEELLLHAKDLLITLGETESDQYAWVQGRLGQAALEKGAFDEARKLFEEALELRKKAMGADHPWVGEATSNLARSYVLRGEHEEAIPIFQEALRIFEARLGKNSLKASAVLQNLALCYHGLKDFKKAQELTEEALVVVEALKGPRSTNALRIRYNLACLRLDGGDARGSERDLRELQALQQELLQPTHRQHAYTLLTLGQALTAQGRDEEAEELFRGSAERLEELFGPESLVLSHPLLDLAKLYHRRGRLDLAEPLFLRALEIRRAAMPPEAGERKAAEEDYARFQHDLAAAQGQPEEI